MIPIERQESSVMVDDPSEDFAQVMDYVSRLHQQTGNLTAAIRYCWSDWSMLVGRGAPFRAIDAAAKLGVSKASIDKAHHVIRKECSGTAPRVGAPTLADESDETSATSSCSSEAGPTPQSSDERDAEGNVVRIRGRWRYTYVRATDSWRAEHL